MINLLTILGDEMQSKCYFDEVADGETCTYHYTSLYDPLGDATHVAISDKADCH